jgi:hypothetical protein
VRFSVALPAIAVFLAFSACSLNERDLDAFRETATGPDKLRAVLRDPSRNANLRASAALALLELRRKGLDGSEALIHDFGTSTQDSRDAITDPLAQGLSARMRTTVGKAPSPSALRAKDAGAQMLKLLSDESRMRLGTSLVTWMLEDMPRRADAGENSLDEISALLGKESVRPLLDALTRSLPASDLARLAELIDRHATAADRTRAASNLVAIERAYRNHVRDAELRELAKHDLQGTAGAEHSELVEARVDALRTTSLTAHVMPALGRFADQSEVRARFVTIARDASALLSDRSLALTLLEGHTTSQELTALLALALDANEEMALRELAVERVGDTRSTEAVPLLLTLASERTHSKLRHKATKLVLDIGGARAFPLLLRSMPRAWNARYGKDELEVYSERIAQFPPEPALLMMLGEKLHSSFWYNRVLALHYFARRGSFDDIWRMRQHVEDTLLITGDGWPRGYTVGQEAEACVAIATERFAKRLPRPSRVRPSAMPAPPVTEPSAPRATEPVAPVAEPPVPAQEQPTL